jgi:hypothetical protein
MDMGMGGKPKVATDVIAEEIAGLAGNDLKALMASKDLFAVTEAITAGALQKTRDLLSQRNPAGLGALLLEFVRCRPDADQQGKVRFLLEDIDTARALVESLDIYIKEGKE